MDDQFSVLKLLRDLQLECSESLYLNWYRFDDVDEMKAEDLSRMFDDIWYPGPDDLDLIHAEAHWILSIDHEGFVKFLNLESEGEGHAKHANANPTMWEYLIGQVDGVAGKQTHERGINFRYGSE